MIIHPRRSVLYVPGSNPRAIDRARDLPVDCIILDLEDSVAPEAKDAARAQVRDAVAGRGFGRREVIVRINGLDAPWWIEDVNAVAPAKPDALLIPKVSAPDPLQHVADRLVAMSADHRIRVWAMLETPLAILNVQAIAAIARDIETRLTAFVMGVNDLARDTRARIVPGRNPMRPWLMTCVAAARAYGIDIIDGVYNDIGNPVGFARECTESRDMGFDGKTLIHPDQIEVCNRTFTPSAEEIAEARKIIAVFGLPENRRKGVIVVDGHMVERLHAVSAHRLLAIAEAIEGLTP